MEEINIEKWERKEHFKFFSGMDYPFYNVCFDLDITQLLPVVKTKRLNFYYTMIYLATLSANQVDEFKYRIRNGKVVKHETIHPSFTDINDGSDLFKIITLDLKENLSKFVSHAEETSKGQSEFILPRDKNGGDDLVFISALPWISYTSISHTIHFNQNDSIPWVSWGKYFNRDISILLPFSLQVNHSFIDGIHVGKYKNLLDKNMACISQL